MNARANDDSPKMKALNVKKWRERKGEKERERETKRINRQAWAETNFNDK